MNELVRVNPLAEKPNHLRPILEDIFAVHPDTVIDDTARLFNENAGVEHITYVQEYVRKKVGERIYSLPLKERPTPKDLVDDAVVFTSTLANVLVEQLPHESQQIYSFFGDVTTAIVGAEVTVVEEGKFVAKGVTSDVRVYNNRGIRDRAIAVFNTKLNYSALFEEEETGNCELVAD